MVESRYPLQERIFSIKAMKTLAKLSKLTFSQHQKLTKIFSNPGTITQKQGLILVKKKKKTTLESFSYLCSSFLDLQFCCSPENQQMIITVKTTSLAATEKTNQGRNLFKTLLPCQQGFKRLMGVPRFMEDSLQTLSL